MSPRCVKEDRGGLKIEFLGTSGLIGELIGFCARFDVYCFGFRPTLNRE